MTNRKINMEASCHTDTTSFRSSLHNQGCLSGDILHLLREVYKIDTGNVLEDMKHMKNEKLIAEHEQFYKIWKSSNGRYMTYLPDKTNKQKRRLLSKSTRENLDNEIIRYYKSISDHTTRFQTLYYQWLELKRLEVSSATIERLHTAYVRFYSLHAINEKQISQIDYLYLKTYLLSTIKEYNMNYKQYCNFSCILRGVLDYALERELIQINPFSRFHVDRNVLRQSDTKTSETEVFTIQEREQLEKLILDDFYRHRSSTIPLAILLDFYTGLPFGRTGDTFQTGHTG